MPSETRHGRRDVDEALGPGHEGGVGVAAVVVPAAGRVDGADAGDGAVDDVDEAFDPGPAGRGNGPLL